MEIEAKFHVNGRENLERVKRIVEGMGYPITGGERETYTDTYYDAGEGAVLRFRRYGDGRIVRTYKRDRKVEGGVIYREERESEVSEEDMRRETEGRTPLLQTYTVRERYGAGPLVLTYDVVWYGDATQMAFVEVEGPEEDVRKVAKKLAEEGFRVETRSKLEIGLALTGGGRA